MKSCQKYHLSTALIWAILKKLCSIMCSSTQTSGSNMLMVPKFWPVPWLWKERREERVMQGVKQDKLRQIWVIFQTCQAVTNQVRTRRMVVNTLKKEPTRIRRGALVKVKSLEEWKRRSNLISMYPVATSSSTMPQQIRLPSSFNDKSLQWKTSSDLLWRRNLGLK